MHARLLPLLCILPSATALAQTGTYTWQVYTDNGAAWGAVAVARPGDLIRVRLLGGWNDVTGTNQGYAGGQFDAVLLGATSQDIVSNIVYPVPFAFNGPNLVATSYDGGVKIDRVSDDQLPGTGTGWINPGQPAFDFAVPGGYNGSNPVVIFTYDVNGSGGDIEFGMVLNSRTQGRAMAVYTSGAGTQQRIDASQVTINTARLTIPAPATLPTVLFTAIVTTRRNRIAHVRRTSL